VACAKVLRRPNPLDASVYRLMLNDVWHLVVLGEGDLPVFYERTFEVACQHGVRLAIPLEVQTALMVRSVAARHQHPGFWERRSNK
jgi:hypothetical protein